MPGADGSHRPGWLSSPRCSRHGAGQQPPVTPSLPSRGWIWGEFSAWDFLGGGFPCTARSPLRPTAGHLAVDFGVMLFAGCMLKANRAWRGGSRVSRAIPGGTAKQSHHQGARHDFSWSAPSARAHHGLWQCPMIPEVSAQVSIAPQPQDSLCTPARGSLPLWVHFRAGSSLWAGCIGFAPVPPLPAAGGCGAPGFIALPPLPPLASPARVTLHLLPLEGLGNWEAAKMKQVFPSPPG